MNVISKLMNPLTLPERFEKAGGLCFAVLFPGALILYCYQILSLPLPAVLAAAALLTAAMLRRKLHRQVMRNSPVIHAVSIGTVTFSMQPPDSFHTLLSEFGIIMAGFASLMFFFGITELLFALPQHFGGGELHPERRGKCFLISLVPCFTGLLFLASETYFVNRGEMQYSYLKFAPHFLVSTLLLSLALTSMLCTLRTRWLRGFCCGLTGLLLCLYGQYMFMNKKLPDIGVEKADWDSMTGDCILNAAVWLLLLALPFLAERLLRKEKDSPVPKGTLLLSALLGGIQLVTLLILAVTAPPAMQTVGVKLPSGKDQFVISGEKNIITIILDAADQHFFEEAYAEQPERFDFLRDFTYYTNTAMLYDSTYLSIPGMLTAAQTIPGDDRAAWYTEICSAEPAQQFYRRLKDAGYTVNAFGEFAAGYEAFDSILDNLSDLAPGDTSIDKDMLYRKIRQMIAYRALPLVLKRFTEPSGEYGNEAVSVKEECVFENAAFLDRLNLRISDTPGNYYTVQHLMGMHISGGMDLNDCTAILKRYFAELKRLGVYDDALIIVTADHGEHSKPVNMPVWYMKKPHETGEQLRFCSAPVSLTDYAATVLDAAGLWQEGDEQLFGKPFSQYAEDELRTRLVFQRCTFQENVRQPEGNFFGYYFTGTKEDLRQHELHDPPDLILFTEG